LSGSFSGCTKLDSIILPNSLVTIDQEMFKNCVNLKSIHIPDGVTIIDNYAFQGCSSLKDLKLPEALIAINNYAFSNCTSIDSLKLPSKLTSLKYYAFDGCTGLRDIKFPDALYELNYYTFGNCSGLKKLVFPRKLRTIGSAAFQNCTSLESIDFPDNLTSLGSGSFAGCTSLTEVKVPNKITDMDGAFINCTGLKKVTLQTGLKRIINSGFKGCTALTSISIPSGVTYISSGAFQDCTGLTDVFLPAGLTSIGSNAFSGCSSLKSIQVPTGVTKLEGMTFNDCKSLTSVTLPEELASMFMIEFYLCNNLTEIINLNPVPIPSSSMANTFNNMDQAKCKLIVQTASVNAYKAADVWKKFDIVDGGYSVIASTNNSMIGNITGANRFYQSNEEVTLEAVSKLGSTFINWSENGTVVSTSPIYKFQVTSNRKLIAKFIREITVNMTNVGSLRDSVFDSNSVSKLTVTGNIDARDIKFMRDNMASLSSIDLSNSKILAYSGFEGTADGSNDYPANVLPLSAFYNNTVLKSIILSKELTVVDDQAFKGCINLSQCIIPESVTNIGSNAFNNCIGLNSIKLPNSLLSIEFASFVNCSNLKSIEFPSGLETIGASAFSTCTSITSLNLPAGLKKLGNSSFSGCTGLTKVVFPGSLSEIEMLTFSNCSNISTIELPEGINHISYGAFSACSSLQYIIFPASLSFIGTGAFGSCEGLKEMTLSSGLAVIANNAFYGCSKLTKITNPNSTPIEITSDVFSGVNQSACSLIVPVGSETAYKNASVWKKFNISGSGYSISAASNNPLVGTISGLANKMYTINDVVTLTAKSVGGTIFVNWTENDNEISTDSIYSFTVSSSRKLMANFKREEVVSLSEAGTLKNIIKNTLSITSLSLTGNIDARDIKYIRDNFPSLASINLQNSHIISYNGSAGTNQFVSSYPENEMPMNSFYDSNSGSYNAIKSIILPNDLDTIGQYAFINCRNLKSITLPNHLKSIEVGAFYGCIALDTITLPAELQYIKSECFVNCDALKKITNLNPLPIYISNDVFTYSTLNTCRLIVPDASVELYKTADMWKGFFEIVSISGTKDSIQNEDSLLIYPIPTKDKIFIKTSDSVKINSLKIYDFNGKVFWTSNEPVSEINMISF
ncbi:MAG: leucine-rich repeat protein, partial [Paludibacter sp.]